MNLFFLTYGDGLSDVNLDNLLSFHKSHGKLVTVTAVHPGARFGELLIENDEVKIFQEKASNSKGMDKWRLFYNAARIYRSYR